MGGPIETTVTFLEMPQPRITTVPCPAGNFAILRALKPQVHFYRYLYDQVGAGYMWVDRRRLSDAQLAEILGDDLVELYVLYVGGCPAGYGELDFRAGGEATLAYFGMLADYAGRGFGKFFLAELIATAWSHEISRLKVQTCTLDHPAALRLYQRLGFVPYAQSTEAVQTLD
ncbi:MAG: GNAT family N-acetyltransferase [Hyphomicrobiales bacterium]